MQEVFELSSASLPNAIAFFISTYILHGTVVIGFVFVVVVIVVVVKVLHSYWHKASVFSAV